MLRQQRREQCRDAQEREEADDIGDGVRMIDEAVAGSWPKRRSSTGTSAPASPAASIEITIASEITPTNASERLHT